MLLMLMLCFSAHWFLAIVCFPGLEKPTENRYIPNPPPEVPPDIPNMPTPPQPTDVNTEEMETDENEVIITVTKVVFLTKHTQLEIKDLTETWMCNRY